MMIAERTMQWESVSRQSAAGAYAVLPQYWPRTPKTEAAA